MIDTVLAPYAHKSYQKAYAKHISRGLNTTQSKKYADEDMRKEIADGIQTIQYQINTLKHWGVA